jgi:hypothetical protein
MGIRYRSRGSYMMSYYDRMKNGKRGFIFKNESEYLIERDKLFNEHGNGWWITWGLEKLRKRTRVKK